MYHADRLLSTLQRPGQRARALDAIAYGDIVSLRETWLRVNMECPVFVGDEGRKFVEPAKPKYSLEELLADCDTTADMRSDEREWLDSGPVGREFL